MKLPSGISSTPICVFGVLLLVAIVYFAACSNGGGGSPARSGSVTLTRLAGGFTHPVTIANAGDGSEGPYGSFATALLPRSLSST